MNGFEVEEGVVSQGKQAASRSWKKQEIILPKSPHKEHGLAKHLI